MSWFLSILVGVPIAVLGACAGFLIGSLNVRWYRISGFEGGSGYYVVMLTLAGGLVGLLTGIVTSRMVAGWPEPGFAKALGLAALLMLGLALLVLLACRLGADVPPSIDGKSLHLEVEVRAPRGLTMPIAPDDYGAHAYVFLPHGRSQPRGVVPIESARQVESRWVLTCEVPLRTSAPRKFLRVYLDKTNDAVFQLPLRPRPRATDFEWSRWIEAGHDVGTARPAPDDAFVMRFRVVVEEPEPDPEPQEEPDHEAEADAALDALADDAPLAAFLEFADHATPPERRARAVARIAARPDLVGEIDALLAAPDDETAVAACYVTGWMTPPPAGLGASVARFAQDLARQIEAGNAISAEADPAYLWAASISVRFSGFMTAARALRGHGPVDFVAELGEILRVARVRRDSYCMRMDVVRVASYWLREWAGIAPLPDDPAPR